MSINFDDPFPEAGQLIGFGQNKIEANTEARDEETVRLALAAPNRHYLLFNKGRVVVRKGNSASASFTPDEAAPFIPNFDTTVLLGDEEGGPLIAVSTNIDPDGVEEPYHLYDLRALLYTSSVSNEEASITARAASLLHWNRTNRFCGRCGQPTQSRIGGYRRDCDHCETTQFPRTDPVVIMLAIHDQDCLLGRSPHFPPGWYSTLAGFVEPGETVEMAVRRETFEESGIRIGRVRYHASQPWPFPHSLMIGCFAEAISKTVDFDTNELEDCRWFSRTDVELMIADNHPDGFKCPPTKAIAHSLIARWMEEN